MSVSSAFGFALATTIIFLGGFAVGSTVILWILNVTLKDRGPGGQYAWNAMVKVRSKAMQMDTFCADCYEQAGKQLGLKPMPSFACWNCGATVNPGYSGGCSCPNEQCSAWYNITPFGSCETNPNREDAPVFALAPGVPGATLAIDGTWNGKRVEVPPVRPAAE